MGDVREWVLFEYISDRGTFPLSSLYLKGSPCMVSGISRLFYFPGSRSNTEKSMSNSF